MQRGIAHGPQDGLDLAQGLALAAKQDGLIAQVIKFLWSSHIRTLALVNDISGGSPAVIRLAAVLPQASGNNPELRPGGGRAGGSGPAGSGRGIRLIIYLVNAKQVIPLVLNHVLGAYRQ